MSSLTTLTRAEGDLLRHAAAGPVSCFDRQSVVGRPTSPAFAPPYLISGWAAHSHEFGDTRRQLIHIVLPGDALVPVAGRGERQVITCLTAVCLVDGESIRTAARDPFRFPGIAAGVAAGAAMERASLMEQVVRVGRLSAHERMASLFVELHRRCSAVGLADGLDIPLPLTQEMIGDLLGLSVVHTNRTLQLMRREGFIELKNGRLNLLGLRELTTIAKGEARAGFPDVAETSQERLAEVSDDQSSQLGSWPTGPGDSVDALEE